MAGPVVAAAGLTAAAGLLQHFMAQRAAQKQAEEARLAERRLAVMNARQKAKDDHNSAIDQMGEREGDAIQNLISVLQRTAR